MKKLLFISLLFLIGSPSFSQQPIFVTISGGDLYSLDLVNCTSNFIGSTGYGFGDIAFTPDGRLWGFIGVELYQIDTTNANATLIGNTGLAGVSLVGLNDSTLLIEVGQNLYGVRNTNASTFLIDTIGYQASGDLTWYDNDLYMTTGALLIKIVLNGTNTAIVSSAPVNNIINPIPTCEGAATASFVGSDNAIIGFSSNNAYKICQIDGTYQMLCPSIVPIEIPGGASIRLPVQVPEPISCNETSVADLTITEDDLFIYPNPTTGKFTVEGATGEIQVYDLFGRLLLRSNNKEIDMGSYPKGVYVLRVGEATRKLILQ